MNDLTKAIVSTLLCALLGMAVAGNINGPDLHLSNENSPIFNG